MRWPPPRTRPPHVLRHTAAMRLLHAGVDTTVIALWLGHEQVETTQMYIKARELHQAGEKPQVASSARVRNGEERPAADAALTRAFSHGLPSDAGSAR